MEIMETKTKMKRYDVIERLIESRIDTCLVDPFYLYDILKNGGITGFVNMNNDELIEEYHYEFDKEIEITN
jgi:hypothetical protein